MTDSVIGARLAAHWKMPESLVEAIEFHHEPELSSNPKLAAVVNVADVMARRFGIGDCGDNVVPDLQPQILSHVGMQVEDVENLFTTTIIAELEAASSEFVTG
ncbi:hypothetical protein BOW53_01230 [Solemya pervernicosa gill symbiont]|uniref:HDOD domain-containing protein n=1 Tax=Solemya pervernicosa gill symbiont TaxID=642797 RepID=A0A1T2LAW5_9GAMM|nr:HDOD domain-containing protein [Solemya pervernicosa gill symbiont]OOZ42231.1 hypothetical protein BOW53_01230 [Solemya pervernicosa gill symbiont]